MALAEVEGPVRTFPDPDCLSGLSDGITGYDNAELATQKIYHILRHISVSAANTKPAVASRGTGAGTDAAGAGAVNKVDHGGPETRQRKFQLQIINGH